VSINIRNVAFGILAILACGLIRVPPLLAQGMTTVCQFSTGPKAGTSFDFRPSGVQPIPVGSPCADGKGSSGTAVASGGGGLLGLTPGTANGGMSTLCQFTTGPKAGTSFDFRLFGAQPIPVGSPCTDGRGSNGTAVTSGVGGLASGLSGNGLTTVCLFNSGAKAGTKFDFRPLGVQPIPVGSACTDGKGSNGTAVP
jgi:hypothetical protein